MRVAALYDIHGNLPALEAVLDECGRCAVQEIVVGGDVLPGPMPRESLDLLRRCEIPVHFIRGNGDRVVLVRMRGGDSAEVPDAFREAIRWNAEQLHADDEAFVASWPATIGIRVPSLGDVLFCHATPDSDTRIFTGRTPDAALLPVFDGLGASIVVCGHTHMQFDRMIGGTRVVNAGSVGMPFGETGAYWLLLGSDLDLRRTTYDLAGAATRIRATRYPQAEAFASQNVLQPPSEESMLDAFAAAELR
jgi:predicted phosphodiesterase